MPHLITQYLTSLAGGMLIGLSTAVVLLFNGRISGILGSLLKKPDGRFFMDVAFVAGFCSDQSCSWSFSVPGL